LEIEISDCTGRVVDFFHHNNDISILSLANYPKGLYIIRGKTNDGISVQKFVKQ
jgi:hypothetical protein